MMKHYSAKVPKCPSYIFIRCFCCGEVHAVKVIKLFSNAKKGRYCVFCRNKFKFYNIYQDVKERAYYKRY